MRRMPDERSRSDHQVVRRAPRIGPLRSSTDSRRGSVIPKMLRGTISVAGTVRENKLLRIWLDAVYG
ncbi:hypothetical protein IG631_14623 [Alternaria alternata]|nr:hypothetical protein IG631_14623 [Alternaria alternata]